MAALGGLCRRFAMRALLLRGRFETGLRAGFMGGRAYGRQGKRQGFRRLGPVFRGGS